MRFGGGARNLLGFVAIAIVAFGATLYLVPGSTSGGTRAVEPGAGVAESEDVAAPSEDGAAPLPPVSPFPDATPDGSPIGGGMRGYALPLAELRGISASSPPGSRLEIWVAWRRDVGGGSQVQRVVTGAVLGAVREPTVPEGPDTVEIYIPVEDFPDFLAAHEFGSLNAALIP